MKVSILIPTFNQSPAFLRAALLSAKHQSHRCEIVIVDDGSNPRQDGVVEEVLAGYSDDEIQAKYVWQENKGVAGALNRALEDATGDWIRWLPSDDLYTLDSTLELLHVAQPDMKVLYSGYDEGIPTAKQQIPAITFSTRERQHEMLKKHCFINAATVMWHKSVFDEIGAFNENIVHAQDYEFLLRCSERYHFHGVPDPFVRRRIHARQMLQTLRTDPAEKEKKDRDMEFLKERYGVTGYVWVPDA